MKLFRKIILFYEFFRLYENSILFSLLKVAGLIFLKKKPYFHSKQLFRRTKEE